MIVTTRDLFTIPGYSERPGFCRGGSRAWFKAHNLNWQRFVRFGIEADQLTATGDALALALVAWASKRQAALVAWASKRQAALQAKASGNGR